MKFSLLLLRAGFLDEVKGDISLQLIEHPSAASNCVRAYVRENCWSLLLLENS